MSQQTIVNGVITDPSGNPYKNCSYSVSLVNNTGLGTLPLLSGSTFQTVFDGGSCDSFGSFSQPLFDNNQITPLGTQWKFSVCDITGKNCFTYTTPICPSAGCITGSSISISSAISAVAPSLTIAGNATVSGNNTFTGINTFPSINNVKYVDGIIYTTLQAAANACGKACIVDDRGCNGTTIPATITGQTYPVDYLLGPCVYNGPNSGSVFLWNSFQQNGSSIIGFSGATANLQANYGNGTVIKASSGNNAPVIQIASGVTVQVLQGFLIQNITFDGNNPGTIGGSPNTNDILYLDAVRNSRFIGNSYNNCSGYMLRTTVTQNVSGNQGNQFNTFDGLIGGGCSAVWLADGNAPSGLVNSSTTTLNYITTIAANYACGSTPTPCRAIEFKQGDGNRIDTVEILSPLNTSNFVGACLQFDSPVASPYSEGGLHNFIQTYHANCGISGFGGDNVRVKAGAFGNKIETINGIENQPDPVVEANAGTTFDAHITKASLTDEYIYSQYTYISFLNSSGTRQATIGPCGGGLSIGGGTGGANTPPCDRSGELDLRFLGLSGSSSGVATLVSGSAAGGTHTLPNNTGTIAELNLAQTFTALQQFTTIGTATNCSVNSVSPAGCGSAASGAFVVPTTTTTYTVNTSAVTATSRVFLQPRTNTGDLPGSPTCVSVAGGSPYSISAQVAGTSFTFGLPSTTGQTCWNYWIID